MIAYVDSSVLLRVILRHPAALPEWGSIEEAVSSVLLEVECLRTLDRLRLQGRLDDPEVAAARAAVYGVLDGVEVVEMERSVLSRASQPMPTSLGTLDAIHLATALLWRDERRTSCVMATHDAALALAARASGLDVVGA